MDSEANWQNTPCNLCMTYLLACADFLGTVHDIYCDPGCAWPLLREKVDSEIFRTLWEGNQISVDAADHVAGQCQTEPVRLSVLGADLESHLCASGLVAEPAAHCTNRFHLPDSWAGTRLQDLKDQKSRTTAPKAVARDSFFWKAKDPASLEIIILELERYELCQFKVASDWHSTSLVFRPLLSAIYSYHPPTSPKQLPTLLQGCGVTTQMYQI